MFEGIFTALVTPFKNQKVDLVSLKKLVEWQLSNGVDGFVINGTTAESPTLKDAEVIEIWSQVKQWVPTGFPLILGTGTNSTESTIQKTLQAKDLGASGALVVVPYYNKPPQEGLRQHYLKVAEAAGDFPILLYNVPGRTIVSLSAETIANLSKHENIVGIKEASGDMDLAEKILNLCDNDFVLTSGDDSSCIDQMTRGGKGVISVASHIIPTELKEISLKAREGNKEAIIEYKKYDTLNRLLGIEPNPIPVKMALYLMGIIDSPELRLPLIKMSEENSVKLKNNLSDLGVI
ncbi:MAG: 4-hydroxy-tetrahydrodipicolinate synthase [Bdellovibrionales bacterium]|nr:4-hydroxy-tetrahydrodipicolinate synthase [Bdellovibrionales bacterium]